MVWQARFCTNFLCPEGRGLPRYKDLCKNGSPDSRDLGTPLKDRKTTKEKEQIGTGSLMGSEWVLNLWGRGAGTPGGVKARAKLNVVLLWRLEDVPVVGLRGKMGVSLWSRAGIHKGIWPGEYWGVSEVKPGLDGN